jgi:IBR domain, a half RING-finger domain
MPAKCCEMIPIHVGAKLLSKEEAMEYRSKFEEWKTDAKDRVYCPKPICSTFIPLKQLRAAGKIPDETNTKEKRDSKDPAIPSLEKLAATPSIDCPKCTTVICITCKSFAHPMEPCKSETQNDEMLALLLKWGYKRCPRCGHGTRKMFGCSHMQCVCGAHWCWGCERGFNECERNGGCEWDEDDDEDMGSDFAEEETDENTIIPEADLVGALSPTTTDNIAVDVEMMDANGTSEGAANASTEASTDVIIGPLTEREMRRQRRAENLDAGGGRYWEQQDLDFGSEPGDAEDGVWGCVHKWIVRADKLEEGMECHQCWGPVTDKAWFCEWCGLPGCGKCAKGSD